MQQSAIQSEGQPACQLVGQFNNLYLHRYPVFINNIVSDYVEDLVLLLKMGRRDRGEED
ncbi:MAG: hypothetical protein L0H55_16905 [Candidatus Nitrosocosmicus sp.]|nr:hypothetical protein [Candidatus Nitrosocosmicus sp.]